jgi:hypothetical protein
MLEALPMKKPRRCDRTTNPSPSRPSRLLRNRCREIPSPVVALAERVGARRTRKRESMEETETETEIEVLDRGKKSVVSETGSPANEQAHLAHAKVWIFTKHLPR